MVGDGRTLPEGRSSTLCRVHAVLVCVCVCVQVEAYVNQLDPVVEALKYLTPLGYDVLTFVVLMHLSLDRQKVCAYTQVTGVRMRLSLEGRKGHASGRCANAPLA